MKHLAPSTQSRTHSTPNIPLLFRALCGLLCVLGALTASAQDTIAVVLPTITGTSEAALTPETPIDTAGVLQAALVMPKRDKRLFTPDPIRAMWIGLVFPGGGQIYNRKYWKLPVFYGGFLGCMYALTWNNQMLRDYSQAYLDIMDDDPNTKSYTKMLPLNYDITGKEERFKTIFKNKKDHFRKYRDMSGIACIAVYAITLADAYIDAELSTFDISPDLSLRLEPAVISLGTPTFAQHRTPKAFGVQCNLLF